MDTLEARLGYHFKTRSLLATALTLPSVMNERKLSSKAYQRLEFLGDAVVDHVVAESLYHMFPDEDEGVLSSLWSRASRESAMARIARELGLGADLVLTRSDESAGARDRDSTLADSLEAVIGAVQVDGGIEASRPLIQRLWHNEFANLRHSPEEQNPKGQLQEMLQGSSWGETPTYRMTSLQGTAHQPRFEAVVVWKGHELGSGSGRGKQEAQVAAARHALMRPDLEQIIQAEQRRPGST